jgi:hypothetical protein
VGYRFRRQKNAIIIQFNIIIIIIIIIMECVVPFGQRPTGLLIKKKRETTKNVCP